MLLEGFPDLFELSVSLTTRAPREGEQNGVQYYFVSKEEFNQVIFTKQEYKFRKYLSILSLSIVKFTEISMELIKDM
jgi:guanylate kinase